MRRTIVALGLAIAVTFAIAAQVPAAEPPLAEVNGEAISAEEVDKAVRPQISKLEEQIYTIKKQRVEAIIRDRLLAQEAKRRGVSTQSLLDAEVTSKVGLVTEQEVEQFYQANKSRFPGDETEARDKIRSGLQGQKIGAKRDEFLRALRAKANVVVHLAAPPVTRVEVSAVGAPAKGPANAPVTIVEFSDFHCPFCKRVNPTLDTIAQRYGDRVRIVFRDFPIDQLHPGARKAHEAARCANEQGKFWAYHDMLFDKAPRATPEDLKTYARDLKLDVAAFDRCVASGKYVEAVRKDNEEGARLGVSGTPAFFINGRLVSGAQPLEAFVQVIDDELTRAK